MASRVVQQGKQSTITLPIHIDSVTLVSGGKWQGPGAAPAHPAAGRNVRAASLLSSSPNDPPIGDGMTPTVPDGEKVSFGMVNITPTGSTAFTCDVKVGSQQVSNQINGTFYVYRESGHGQDSYLVVYKEDAILSTTDSNHPLLVSVIGANKWDGSRAGIGYVLCKLETGAVPVAINQQPPSINNMAWVSTSPATVNKESSVNDQTVESFNQSVTLSGKDGASATFSHDFQIWHGTTITVTDWAMVENTDAATKRCSWLMYQNSPWSGLNSMSDFGWWEQAYNVGGNWDDVKAFSDLSTGVMQYHTCAAWRFTNPSPGSPFSVRIQGGLDAQYCLIAMPQLGDTGHHNLYPRSLNIPWSVDLDLTKLCDLE